MIRKFVLLAAGVLLLAGCGGGGGTKRHAAATAPRPALPQPAKRCGTPFEHATTLRFPAKGGVQLDGALVGHGPTGVVLLHEYPGPMCGWWPYATYLAHHGMQALLFDFRCFGLSGCPKSGRGDPVADTAAAMNVLRERGAKKIAIVGASLGGVASVMAAAKLRPAALVDLSGERALGPLMQGVQLDAYRPAARVTAPALFVVAHGDANTPIPDMRAVYRRAASKTKRLIVLPASYGHGWDMLVTATGWTRMARTVASFIAAHAR